MLQRQLPVPPKSFFLFGPRGTGKTSWLHQRFPEAHVIDLLSSSVALDFLKNPSLLESIIRTLPKSQWIAIDEVQKVPALLDAVHLLMENDGYKKFVLTGSSARKLKRGGANLLAGRATIQKMFPLTSHETNYSLPPEQILTYGMMPMSVMAASDVEREAYLTAYVDTYLREEIKEEGLVRQLASFVRFLDVAALSAGQVTNTSGIARDAGVSRDSVRGYFDILTDTLLGQWLPAFRPRAKIKEIAHPKFYWFDSGVLTALAGGFKQPLPKDWKGVALEHWIFHEISAFLHYSNSKGQLCYWRTPSGSEVDFVWQYGDRWVAIEIKASETFKSDFAQGIRSLSESKKVQGKWIVYLGKRELKVQDIHVMPIMQFLKKLHQGDILGT